MKVRQPTEGASKASYAFPCRAGGWIATPHCLFDKPCPLPPWSAEGHGNGLGDEGKAVGTVPPTALLFKQLNTRSAKPKFAISLIAMIMKTMTERNYPHRVNGEPGLEIMEQR
jgi:hypothetical protein